MPPDALVYCSSKWEEEPKGSVSSAYESDMVRGVNSGEESETALVVRVCSRRASDQRAGVRRGRTLINDWPSVEHRVRTEMKTPMIGWIRLLSYNGHK